MTTLGRNLIIPQSQIMLVVIQHGKKRSWALMPTGEQFVDCIPTGIVFYVVR